jgi:acyl-coenzyme A thioesterase PaaI-like protein
MKIHKKGAMLEKTIESAAAPQIGARAQSSCFACGPDNPRGLLLRFEKNEAGEMTAEWIPESFTEGFDGIVHGGIVSTVLDEAMAKAVVDAKLEALTAELRVRFRRHVASGSRVQIRGWIYSRNKRVIKTEAAITSADGTELAHAWASFLALK